MKRLAYTLPIIILLVVLFIHYPAKTVHSPSKTDPQTPPAAGSLSEELTAEAGTLLTIDLRSNPTTGYRWELAAPVDRTLLEPAGNDYEPDRTGLIGSGGTEHWTFETLRAGKTNVHFKYVRPWEKDQAPAEEKRFEIIIQKSGK